MKDGSKCAEKSLSYTLTIKAVLVLWKSMVPPLLTSTMDGGEFLTQSLWNSVCTSWNLSPSQRRQMCILPIVARQRLCKNFTPAINNMRATLEELLDSLSSMRSASYQRQALFLELIINDPFNDALYSAEWWEQLTKTRVEASWNTSTVALRAVRGDKKGSQFPGV
jgi:hypothetical protein